MILKELLKTIEIIEEKNNNKSLNIKGIANHTDNIKDGYLYVAIKGYITDGHKYVEEAINNGAIAVVVEEFTPYNIPQFKVKNSRESLAILSDKFFNHPSRDIRMIGVTATNGKTSTTYMLNEILKEAKYKRGLLGSVINQIGDKFIESDLTTPESVDLQGYLYEMKEAGVEKVAMEVSSSALELYRTKNVDFDIISFNNFSREHIDQHGSFEKYWGAKSSFITEAKEDTYAVLNLDDKYVSSLLNKTNAKVITYSLKNKEGHLYCKDLNLDKGRATFTVAVNKPFKSLDGKWIDGDFKVILGIPGYHSVANSMAAITIALIDGISPDIIKSALKRFSGVERRFQYIYEDDFIIIDDHFANRGNINVSLETLKYMEYEKLHLVYAIRGSRGVTVNRENAETIASWKERLNIKEIIATKSIGNTTTKDIVLDEEVEVFMEVMKESGIKVHLYDNLKDSIEFALNKVNKDDIIMLAGCQGMDHGGKIALDILNNMKPDIPEEELYKPIINRVV